MLKSFLALLTLPLLASAVEAEKQFENDQIRVMKILIQGGEEIGFNHYSNPRVAIAIQGGILTRIQEDGTCQDVVFPTGKAVFLEADQPGEQHRAINRSENPLEVIVVHLKKKP